MKNYLWILLLILCLSGCMEDETVDITVMPVVTATGEDTFGCLVDGWLYVGGRYKEWFEEELKSIRYKYDAEKNEIDAEVSVKADLEISFTILSPQAEKECTITNIRFGQEELEDGTVRISRFDRYKKIVSGTFSNGGRLTHGRFDVHFKK